jgi:hypothetical protein
MNRILVYGALLAFVCPGIASAYDPRVIETPSQNEVMPLEGPTVAQEIHGNLEGYPHMFEFATKEPMKLKVAVAVPDIASARDNVSVIVLFVNRNGSVKEVARLRAREAAWGRYLEPWGGNAYRAGGSFEGDIEPGTYRIEVSTPDNIGKYALSVGTERRFFLFRYPSLLGQTAEIKAFFGKSSVRMVESPLVYGPLLIAIAGAALYYYRRRTGRGVQ